MQNKDSLKLFSLLNEGNIDEFRHTIQKYTAEELSEIKHPSTTQTLLSFILSKRQNINQIILNTKVLLTQTSGLGVNFPCKMASTPLIQAITFVGNSKTEVDMSLIKLLLNFNANPNQKDPMWGYPLENAISNKNSKIVSELLKASADINQPFGKKLPLELAVEVRNKEVCRILLAADADQSSLSDEQKEFAASCLKRQKVPDLELSLSLPIISNETVSSARHEFQQKKKRSLSSLILQRVLPRGSSSPSGLQMHSN